MVSIPLKYREEVTGFLNLAANTAKPFRASRRKRYFFSILGNQIGLAIENARLYHELRRSERRYRRIFEGSKDLIFVTDREGRLLDLNPAGVELLKFSSKAEAVNLPHVREVFQNPRDWERFQLLVEVEGFIRDLELTLKPRQGSLVYTLLTGIVRRNQEGAITGYEGILKDITERKRGGAGTPAGEEDHGRHPGRHAGAHLRHRPQPPHHLLEPGLRGAHRVLPPRNGGHLPLLAALLHP